MCGCDKPSSFSPVAKGTDTELLPETEDGTPSSTANLGNSPVLLPHEEMGGHSVSSVSPRKRHRVGGHLNTDAESPVGKPPWTRGCTHGVRLPWGLREHTHLVTNASSRGARALGK